MRVLGILEAVQVIVELLSDKPLVVHSYSDYLTAVDLAVSGV